MFLQHEHTAALIQIANKQPTVNEILSVLSANSDADMERSFRESMQQHPHDPTPRLIYADWLEEHGRPTEAHLHRSVDSNHLLGLIHTDPRATAIFTEPNIDPVDNPALDPTGKGRRVSPLRASLTARDISHNRGRQIERGPGVRISDAFRAAREHAVRAVEAAREGDSERAREHHYQAAVHHLEAARDFERRIGGRMRLLRQYLYRREFVSQLPESREALAATRAANRSKTSEAHAEAARLHEAASQAHIRLVPLPIGEHGDPHIGASQGHYNIAQEHTRIAEGIGTEHRIAARAHMIAAGVHKGEYPEGT